MNVRYCIIRPIYFDFDGTELASIGMPPFIQPIMYSLHRKDVLEFDTFGEAYKYVRQMNSICQDDKRYQIVSVKRGEEYAQQVVDRYREYKAGKDARRYTNAVVFRISSLRSKVQ